MSPLQYCGESDSIKKPTVSSLASLRDKPFLAAEGDDSESQALSSKFVGQSILSSYY